MEELEELVSVLKDIKLKSKNIIKDTLPLIESISKDNSETFQTIFTAIKLERTDLTEDQICEIVQQGSLLIIKDPKNILDEIDKFSVSIKRNISLDRLEKDCPFLSEVWCGDSYGSEGVDALKELSLDLDEQAKKCTIDGIIETCLKNFQYI